MEKIENEVEETLEDNQEQNGNNSEGESPSDAPESDGKVLSDSEYQEYRKLKRLSEKGSKESEESSSESKEINNSADVEALIFANAGITDESAIRAAKKLVALGEASNLMEATKDDFVVQKQENAEADSSRKTATPPSSNRVPAQKKDTVEHWVDREGLPENAELRYKVVEARRAKRGGQQMFGSPRKVVIK